MRCQPEAIFQYLQGFVSIAYAIGRTGSRLNGLLFVLYPRMFLVKSHLLSDGRRSEFLHNIPGTEQAKYPDGQVLIFRHRHEPEDDEYPESHENKDRQIKFSSWIVQNYFLKRLAKNVVIAWMILGVVSTGTVMV